MKEKEEWKDKEAKWKKRDYPGLIWERWIAGEIIHNKS